MMYTKTAFLKNLLVYSIGFGLLIILFYFFVSAEHLALLKNATFGEIAVACLIAYLIFCVSGSLFAVLFRKATQKQFCFMDILTFPAARGLWGFIIPFQGSIAYTLLFCKMKYQVALGKTLSFNIYLLLFNIMLTGIFGVWCAVIQNKIFSLLFVLSLIFLMNPVMLLLVKGALNLVSTKIKANYIGYFKNTIESLFDEIIILWKDKLIFSIVLAINIVHVGITVGWYVWMSQILDLNLSFFALLMLTMIQRISLILKFTPGNLGVNQLFSGFAIYLVEEDVAMGILLSTFGSAIVLLLVSSIGSLATLYNLKYFSKKKIGDMYQALTKFSIETP